MTDNEKRAHDLTMLYIKEIFELKLSEFSPMSNSEHIVNMNFISDYCKTYPKILNEINNHFSE